jgi:hypothetical protein
MKQWRLNDDNDYQFRPDRYAHPGEGMLDGAWHNYAPNGLRPSGALAWPHGSDGGVLSLGWDVTTAGTQQQIDTAWSGYHPATGTALARPLGTTFQVPLHDTRWRWASDPFIAEGNGMYLVTLRFDVKGLPLRDPGRIYDWSPSQVYRKGETVFDGAGVWTALKEVPPNKPPASNHATGGFWTAHTAHVSTKKMPDYVDVDLDGLVHTFTGETLRYAGATAEPPAERALSMRFGLAVVASSKPDPALPVGAQPVPFIEMSAWVVSSYTSNLSNGEGGTGSLLSVSDIVRFIPGVRYDFSPCMKVDTPKTVQPASIAQFNSARWGFVLTPIP